MRRESACYTCLRLSVKHQSYVAEETGNNTEMIVDFRAVVVLQTMHVSDLTTSATFRSSTLITYPCNSRDWSVFHFGEAVNVDSVLDMIYSYAYAELQ